MGVLAVVAAVLALVFGVQRLLHHDGSKSFTVKMDLLGDTAFMVATVPAADFTALRDKVTTTSEGFGSVYLTDQRQEGALVCTKSGRLGESQPLDPKWQPYAGDEMTIKIYGSGLVADLICEQLQQQGF
jgi:hypothetical protein